MARFVPLVLSGSAVIAMLGVTASLSALHAQAATPATTAPAKTPPAKASAAPDRYARNAASAGATQSRAKLPFPDAGEVKVPTPDEIAMRLKIEALAALSDDEIHTQLMKWPDYSKMTLRDQGALLMRIQDFRDFRSRTAVQAAHDMGLTALTPDQKTKFEKDYWDKRLKMDEDLAKQFGPAFKARQQQMENELVREYSPAPAPIAQGPQPAIPPAPTTAQKPTASATNSSAGSVAQSPH